MALRDSLRHDLPMILSGAVKLDPAAHAAHTASLRERLDALDVRRRRADRAIEAVLTTWHGHAADAFRERWEEWRSATAGVVQDLAAAAQGLDLARLDVVTVDERNSLSAARIAGRLE